MKFRTAALASIFLFSMTASAIFNYEIYVPKYLNSYFTSLVNDPLASAVASMDANPQRCSSVYQNMLKDGILDIHYALGYFDDSAVGGEKSYTRFANGTGLEKYGRSPSLDVAMFQMIRDFMVAPCTNSYQQSCGFKETGDPLTGKVVLEKQIPLFGQNILARITLTHASASQNYDDNLTTLADTQRAFTFRSEDNYFESIKNADIIFYNGHSRHGGGPDFSPVVLKENGTPDYEGYYKVRRTGIRRVLKEVKNRKDNNFILGLFSCYSASYYQAALFQAKPGLKSIFTVESITYFDTLLSSMGYLEGFMHGMCGSELSSLARQTDSVRKGILDFNFGLKTAEKVTIKAVPQGVLIMD